MVNFTALLFFSALWIRPNVPTGFLIALLQKTFCKIKKRWKTFLHFYSTSKQDRSRVHFIYTVYGVLNTNFGIYNSKIWAFYALLFLSFKTPIFSILVIKMPHFGVLCAKSVLWNFIKVKCHFWRLVFLKLTPGLNSKLIKLFNLSGKI